MASFGGTFSPEARLAVLLELAMRTTERTLREQQILELVAEEANSRSFPLTDWLSWARDSLSTLICSAEGCELPTESPHAYCVLCSQEMRECEAAS